MGSARISPRADKSQQFWAKGLALITLPAIQNWYAHKDTEWYQNLPEWKREQGLNFNIGTDENPTLIYSPLPPVAGTLFAGIPTRLLDAVYREVPRGLRDFESTAYHLALEPLRAAGTMAAPIPGPAAALA